MHIFYWAAYYGRKKTINLLIRHRKWSPYIKSFKNQSVMTSAVRGERLELVNAIVLDYEYIGMDSFEQRKIDKAFFNKDYIDNNCLHFAYSIDIPEIRTAMK